MIARRIRTLRISESRNRSRIKSAHGLVIGARRILRHLSSLAIRFAQLAVAANFSKGSFCVVRDMVRSQTTAPATSIPISPLELVSAIVALDVMAGRAGRQVPEV